MLWTLVYIVMVQGGATDGGTPELTSVATGMRFTSQQECVRVADTAAPGLMKGHETFVAPGNIGGKPANAVTVRPLCLPAPK